jgi:hypothetical protein
MLFTKKDTRDIFDFLNLFKIRDKYNVIYQNFTFIGLFCLFLIYFHSNNLLIPYKDLAIVGFLADILVTFIFFKFYWTNFTIFWALLHNLTIGFIAIYLFVWTNDNFSTKPTYNEILPIENVDIQDNHQRHNRGFEPVITVIIKGTKKQIIYHQTAFKSVMKSREVEVTIKEGFWGYWVLSDIELVDNE